MTRRFLLPILVLALYTLPGLAQGPSRAVKLEDISHQLGPFNIRGQQFTVVVYKKRIAGSKDPDFGETLVGVEIKDANGKVHYQEKSQGIPEVSGSGFGETTDISVRLLQGKQGTGLLVVYGSLPSTPLGGASWQVFGLFDQKLVPFSKPLYLEGALINPESTDEVIHTADEPNFQGEVLRFRVWTGNFFVIYPARVDWFQAKMMPTWFCTKMTARGPKPLCQYHVETDRVPAKEELTFVRLFPEPEEGFMPAHVVVKGDSKVEFLEVECEVVWKEDADAVSLTVSGDDA